MYKLKNEISKMDVEVILALAECGLSPSRAAREMNVHRNTVLYHIEEIKKFTGLDPLDFFDMVTLWKEYGACLK
ncbi:MAG: helix-turn-helix domain-containing protein [Bacteroidales bacterium]|nr:helix-turn-helix domain-containing protein [Bacteroidales bacterium]